MVSAGRVAPVPKGDWNGTTTYYMLDIVTYNNTSWIAKRESLGQTPQDGAYWQVFGGIVPIATTSVAGKVKPDGSTILVEIDGTIYVHVGIEDLVDVDIDNLQPNQVLKWDGTAWVNSNEAGGLVPHLIIISETGSVVTVSKGLWSTTATETSTGHFECDVPEFGTYTIDAVLGGDDAQVSLVVDTVKVYTVDDSHFHADITVTYPTGATVSCSKSGETTMYATGSPYTFTVHSSGTWTITGVKDGVTVTEDVVISTSGQTESVSFIHTISVDLYSAASDTVSFTDASGLKTATTDTSGKAENVSIAYDDFGTSITFTSSVAKDPDNLSNDYSKTVTISNATTEIYLMPSGVEYWYGYNNITLFEDFSSAHGWSGTTMVAPSYLTNYISMNPSHAANVVSGLGSINKITKTVHAIIEGVYSESGDDYGQVGALQSKVFAAPSPVYTIDTTSQKKYDATINNAYGIIWANNNRNAKLYALWTE